ncbi:MAG TPA: alpha/beta hydrolase [Kofleriaceae bacterium]
MALDEATAAFMTQLAASGAKPLHEMSPEEARGFGAMLRQMYGPGPEVGQVREERIPVGGGATIPARLLIPTGAPRGVIVYLHGGGWVIGAVDEFDALGRNMAQRTGAAVVLVDYRLAPEHRFPTAVEDSFAAVRWVDEHMEQIAGRRVPLVVAGDSVGGNLSAVVSLRARAAGAPRIAAQVLVYPVTDANFETATYLDPANQLLLSRNGMIWFWNHYAPDPAVRAHPDASPLRAADLTGLPPAIVVLAEHDVLRREGEAYADRLRAAGVPVSQRCFAGQMHGFFTILNLPASGDALEHVAQELEPHLAPAH